MCLVREIIVWYEMLPAAFFRLLPNVGIVDIAVALFTAVGADARRCSLRLGMAQVRCGAVLGRL